MIREFAYGFSRRHHFQPSNKMQDWMYIAKDVFISLYAYDKDVIEYVQKHKRLSGYNGAIYMPKEYLLDVDGDSVDIAQKKTIDLCDLIQSLDIPYNVYFSGRGFHIGLPDYAFKWEPCADLHLKVKKELDKHGIYEFADPSVTDKTRIIRLPFTMNQKSGLWKIPLTEKQLLTLKGDEISELAKKYGHAMKIDLILPECEPVFDCLTIKSVKKTTKIDIPISEYSPDPINYPCIQTMLNGTGYGGRHAMALRLAAWFRWLYPENIVRLVMEDWRQRVDSDKNPFKKDEMDKIVTDCYKGHNGSGYRYGCMDKVMDSHCKTTCRLYKAKKSQTIITPKDIENQLINFYTTDIKPVDIGEQYGQPFPIYPGEVVVIQAPPKSMKTMILQNWVNSLKKETYFLEMEMSPRQVMSRFIMIEKGWDEDDIKDHFSKGKNGILQDDFGWLTVDYSSCYPNELDNKLSMLPKKPEILVVDHMGLMNTKHRDLNMKMEEITQALTDIAISRNIVVFCVCEITKSAFHEGMNIASGRGSFRIAYSASKVLSLKPTKDGDGKIVSIQIKTEANREKEQLNTTLFVDKLRLGVPKTYEIDNLNLNKKGVEEW